MENNNFIDELDNMVRETLNSSDYASKIVGIETYMEGGQAHVDVTANMFEQEEKREFSTVLRDIADTYQSKKVAFHLYDPKNYVKYH